MLARLELDPVSPRDFEDPENREIFRVWREMVNGENTPSLEELCESLPAPLRPRVNSLSEQPLSTLRNTKWLLEAQVDPGQDIFDLDAGEIKQDMLNSLLKLRERNLLRKNAEIRFLLEDADAADTRLYRQAAAETITALSRLQRTISARLPSDPGDRDDEV